MRKTITDHRTNKLPPKPELDLVLYHWSPTYNRKGIQRYGLRPHQRTLQGDWKPPYVCFSDEPILAWTLSGAMWPHIESWDLWMCYDRFQTSYDHFELILDTYPDTGRHYIKEYRIYTRVFKRDLRYVGSRSQTKQGL